MPAGWRLALRTARREAQRHRGRSALIVAMIALPVLGLGAVDIVIRTADLDPAEEAIRTLGTADLSAQLISDGPVEQTADDPYNYTTSGDPAYGASVPPLPDGSTAIPTEFGSVTVRTIAGERSGQVATYDATSELSTGLIRLESGQFPTRPGEVAISPALAEATGVALGGQLQLADGTPYDVVGLVLNPRATGDDTIVAPPGSVPFTVYDPGPATPPVFLIDLPPTADAGQVWHALNEAGYLVQLRDWLLDPPPTIRDPAEQELTVGLTIVTVGLALLQVVLLAGAAFAVGARRQRRALGLYGAIGATPREVGRSVLAGGLVLGVVAAVVGLLAAGAVAVPLRAVVEDRLGVLYGDWHVRWYELAAVAVLGVLTGLLAAWQPARVAAKLDPLLALAQRPDPPRSGRQLTVGGLGLAAVGLAVTVFGATRQPPSYSLILGGAVAVELGFVLCAPALVGAAGRLAAPLPVPLRMALRDAARNRNRSGPAVAAVMAALAGCVAISIFFVSQDRDAEQTYAPMARFGQVVLYPGGTGQTPQLTAGIQRDLAAALPGAEVVGWRSAGSACATPECLGYTGALLGEDNAYANAAIGGPDVLQAAYGEVDPAAAQALADGKVVVLGEGIARDGTIDIPLYDAAGTESLLRDVPAVTLPAPAGYLYALALLSPDTAAGLGLVPVGLPTYILDRSTPPTNDERDRLTELGRDNSVFSYQVEAGYESPAGPVLLALLGASVVVVLGATAISTGLAAADGRADLSTLAAVGAAPRTRRLLAMAQAAVVALLGAILGALAGFVPAAALVETLGDWPLVVPWSILGAILVVVPLLAAGCAGLFTRSRLPMLRRTA